MNLVDAVLILAWVRAGFANEANPLLDEIVEEHAMFFVLGKLALVFLGTTLLWMHRERPLAVVGIFAAFMVYYAVLLHHLRFASVLRGATRLGLGVGFGLVKPPTDHRTSSMGRVPSPFSFTARQLPGILPT